MYLHPHGRLETDPPQGDDGQDEHQYRAAEVGAAAGMHGGGPFAPSWVMPLDQRVDEISSLTYSTEPLETDLEVTGHPRAVLHVSSTADVAMFVVKLCDVAPDGTSALVTKGYLNVTHRDSHAEPTAIEPGTVYELEVELLACAYRFREGHRIRLDIAGGDFQNVWPTPKQCVNSIHRSEARPSRIVLPVLSAQVPALPDPDLKPATSDLPRREELSPPEYSISRDPINETATAQFGARFGAGTNNAKFTVSSRDPAQAVAQADADITCELPGKEVVVKAQCVTSSDEASFHHVVDVNITINGMPHFTKGWSASVPRGVV